MRGRGVHQWLVASGPWLERQRMLGSSYGQFAIRYSLFARLEAKSGWELTIGGDRCPFRPRRARDDNPEAGGWELAAGHLETDT